MKPIAPIKEEVRRRPQQHLINILCDTQKSHPIFTLFLGAGSSVTSGVMPAKEMIKVWRDKYWQMYGELELKEDFFSKCSWYDSAQEYSMLFEALYDQPSQRREYIETCLNGSRPSWGYIYLVNLLKHQCINTVFTTNFDDLLNEACYLFSDSVRPIVCAHDSSIRFIRLSSKRPKIIKLHGDFLFDNIKNTVRELESLEDNMREKFRQCAAEYGMIVVGYAGNDRSVMEALNTLLRHDANFPHGIYWCIRKGSEPSKSVLELCRYSRFNLVEIQGFDEFFAEAHEALGVAIQPEMSNPYQALASKLNGLIDAVKLPTSGEKHKIIHRDIALLAKRIARLAPDTAAAPPAATTGKRTTKSGTKTKAAEQIAIPYGLLAQVETQEGKIEDAKANLLLQLQNTPTLQTFALALRILETKWDDNFGKDVMQYLRRSPQLFDSDPNEALDFCISLIKAKQFDLADEILDLAHRRQEQGFTKGKIDTPYLLLNKAQIKCHKGIELTAAERQEIETIIKLSDSLVTHYGGHIVLGKYEDAQADFVTMAASGEESPFELKRYLGWPISDLLPKEKKQVLYGVLHELLDRQLKNRQPNPRRD